MQNHFRSLMLIKTVSKPRELVVMSDREFDAASAEAAYLSLPDILYNMDVLTRARARMRDCVSPRTELEMALVKLCSPQLDKTDEALFARVTALEKAIKLLQSGNALPSPALPLANAPDKQISEQPAPVAEEKKEEKEPSAPPVQDKPAEEKPKEEKPIVEAKPEKEQEQEKEPAAPAPPVHSARKGQVDMTELINNATPFELWPDVVSNLRHYSRAISAAFEDTNAYVSGDFLLIETNHEIAFELLKKSSQREEIRKAVQEVTGRVYRLGPYKLPEKKESKDDVLDGFVDRLKNMGVKVTVD